MACGPEIKVERESEIPKKAYFCHLALGPERRQPKPSLLHTSLFSLLSLPREWKGVGGSVSQMHEGHHVGLVTALNTSFLGPIFKEFRVKEYIKPSCRKILFLLYFPNMLKICL